MLDVIDYTPGKSLLHRLNPVTKLALAAAIITATFLAQSPFVLMALLALTLGIGAYAGVARRLTGLLKVLPVSYTHLPARPASAQPKARRVPAFCRRSRCRRRPRRW